MSKIVLRTPVAALIGLTVIAAGLGVPAIAASAQAPSPACAAAAPSELAALAVATACRQDVAVASSQSEYSQVIARADGRLVFESAVVPQRARQADGSWKQIDLGLASSANGLLRPRVSIADVAFSSGGGGPLVTMRRNGKTMTMSFPGSLPKPVVVGDSATYPGVLRDVDLVVRATRTGFTHVLVVKTPAAAALVGKVQFDIGGDVKVARSADGSLRAVAGGTIVASAKPAMMWDSGTAAGPSSARGAGETARVRPLRTEIAGNSLVLRPDVSLLSASAYPLYVDPDWEYGSGSGQKWAYATSNNAGNTDYSVARVGKDPNSSTVYRSFFEFPTLGNTATGQVSLKGKHIRAAHVHMKLTHSSSCSDQYTYMYLTPVINATMKASWSSMTLSSYLASQKGHANTSGCGADQGDMDMNFFGSMTSQVQTAANSNWNSITVGFAARDTSGGGESTHDRWMKYYPEEAKLVVEYDTKPGAPVNLQVATVACPGSGVLTVGTLTPTLSAAHPDADPDDSLTGAYEWVEVPAGGIGAVTDTSPARLTAPSSLSGISPGGRATTTALSGVVKSKTYAFRAKSTDRAPYNLTSNWSGWCQFTVDTSVPPVTVTVLSEPVGPGKPGTFKFTSTATDVTKFKYGWGGATTEVTATGTSPKTATITVTAPKYGKNILYASAVDATLNEGFASTECSVGRPSPAVGTGGLAAEPGVTQANALADQQPALAGDTPLTASNVTWPSDVHLVGGQTATFNGSSSHLTGSGAVFDATKTFSIGAWVRLEDKAADRTIATKDASGYASLYFQYQKSTDRWLAQMPSTTSGGGGTWQNALSTSVPSVNVWTHVACVFNASDRTLKLYVNGVLESTVTGVTAFNDAQYPFWVGRSYGTWWKGSLADVQVFDRALVGNDFTGQLASDPNSGGFNEPGVLAPVQAGSWDFNAGADCYVSDLRDACEVPDTSAWGRWLALSRGSDIGAGRSTNDGGLWLDSSYFPDEGYTESTLEWGRTANKTGVTPPDGDGLEYTTWQNTAVLRTDQSFTVSAWVNIAELASGNATVLGQDGGNVSGFYLGTRNVSGSKYWAMMLKDADNYTTESRYAGSIAPLTTADVGKWVHLTGVFDAQRSEIKLYLNGVLQHTAKRESAPGVRVVPWQATGALTVGRSWYAGAAGDWFKGSVDDVRVFQGVMTDAAVVTLYNS